MALVGSEALMAAAVVAQLKALNPEITGDAEAALLDYWTKISKGIIDTIVANAVISTLTIGVAAGVTSGGATAPTTGTGTGAVL